MLFNYVDLLGKEFEYLGRGPDKFDCLGLVIELFKRRGLEFPDYPSIVDMHLRDAQFQSALSSNLFTEVSVPSEHTVVLFNLHRKYTTHMGYMLNGYEFLHIIEKANVCKSRIDIAEWSCRVKGFYKLK